jgi:hypothetical protein
MKLHITVVYPVSFDHEVPDNFAELSYAQQVAIKEKISQRADNYLVNDPVSPVIQDVQDNKGETFEPLMEI